MLKQLEPSQVQQSLMTGEELASRDDLGRGELIKGVFVEMPPPGPEHGRIEARITILLGMHLEERDTGIILSGEAGMYVSREPDTVRAVDAAYISHERYAKWTDSTYLTVAPELVVEVLSPSDRWMDVSDKVHEYFEAGVELVWIIDPRRQEVTVFETAATSQRLTLDDTLQGGSVLPEFSLPLQKLFRIKGR